MKWTHLLYFGFIADRSKYGRAYATVLRPSVVCTECMVVKRCILEQKLLLTQPIRSRIIWYQNE